MDLYINYSWAGNNIGIKHIEKIMKLTFQAFALSHITLLLKSY